MTNENWLNYKESIRERLRLFALAILDLSQQFPKSTGGKVVNYQLTKAGTSMYVNYRSALRGRSKAEFFSKLCVAVEETDETEAWLELIICSKMIKNEIVKEVHAESIELLKILSSMRRRMS